MVALLPAHRPVSLHVPTGLLSILRVIPCQGSSVLQPRAATDRQQAPGCASSGPSALHICRDQHHKHEEAKRSDNKTTPAACRRGGIRLGRRTVCLFGHSLSLAGIQRTPPILRTIDKIQERENGGPRESRGWKGRNATNGLISEGGWIAGMKPAELNDAGRMANAAFLPPVGRELPRRSGPRAGRLATPCSASRFSRERTAPTDSLLTVARTAAIAITERATAKASASRVYT